MWSGTGDHAPQKRLGPMSFLRDAGFTRETKMCNRPVWQEKRRETSGKEADLGGSHDRPLPSDRIGNAWRIATSDTAVALPDVPGTSCALRS
jgi:hypothetical protein